MAKITLQFKDTKNGVDVELDAASFKRIKKSNHKITRAEELAVRTFVLFKDAEAVARQNELGGPLDEVVPVRGKACCGGACDCGK